MHFRCTGASRSKRTAIDGRRRGGSKGSRSDRRAIRTTRLNLPAERETDGAAPEVELAGREREVAVLYGVLQIAEVPQVAAEPDVVGHEAHRADAEVHAPVVAVDREQLSGVLDVRLQQAETTHDVRPEARAMLPAHRDAEHDVRHQVLNVVAVCEADVVGLVLEKRRRVRPIGFEAGDARTHPSERSAVGQLVVRRRVAAEADADVRRKQPVGARARRPYDQHQRGYQSALLQHCGSSWTCSPWSSLWATVRVLPAREGASKMPAAIAKLNETIERIELVAGRRPSARARERGRMLEQQPPRAARVDARRAQVADRHAERERPIEAGMRKKYVAAGIYGVEHAFVEAIQLRRRERDRLWSRPEADRRERNRRQPLEIRMLIHARGELVRETDVLAQHGAEARRAKMPKNHPKL